MDYAQHFSTRETSQSAKADVRQVPNSAGGFTFAVDRWKRMERFLILGAEGGTYYTTEQELVVENAKSLAECFDEDGARAVELIASISESGRAPKNDPAIFALAFAAGHPKAKAAALAALPRVCRIGTHLFQFVEAVQKFRGWGRSLQRAIAGWYSAREPRELMYQLTKYQQRGGVSHVDVLRQCHLAPKPEHQAIIRWVVDADKNMGQRAVKNRLRAGEGREAKLYDAVGEVPEYLSVVSRCLHSTDPNEVVRLVTDHRLPHEVVPPDMKGHAEVWEALLGHMPPTASIRNLGKMTAVGLLKPMGAASKRLVERFTDAETLRKARVHPMSVLLAMKIYEQGRGEKGKLSWAPVREIVDALDEAFYLAFQNVEPSGKRTLLALDVSGSMEGGTIAGAPGVTPRVAAAAMAMVTARVEKDWHCVGFTSGAPGEYRFGAGKSQHSAMGYASSITDLKISPKQRLDDIVNSVRKLPMGGTDCALPMLYALDRGLEVDVFHVYTDNETWAGDIHPHQALQKYREKTGIPAKLVVVGMTSTGFTIADPTDAGMLDVVGMDAAAPAVMADFARN